MYCDVPLPQGTPKVGSRSNLWSKEGRQACKAGLKAGRKSSFPAQKTGFGPTSALAAHELRQVTASVLLRAGAKELMHLINTCYQYNCLLFRQKSRTEGANLTVEAAALTCYHCAQYQFSIPLPHRSLRPHFL